MPPKRRVGSGGEHPVERKEASDGRVSLPQGSSVPAPKQGQAQDSSPPATLEEALDSLRGDDAEQAVRIRGAAAVVEEGNKSQIEAL